MLAVRITSTVACPPMAAGPPSSLVRPEFGPTLPVLLRARLGPRWPQVAGGLAAAIVVAALVAVLSGGDDRKVLVHRGALAFTILFDAHAVRSATPEGEELARLTMVRPRVTAEVTVQALHLAPYRGEVSSGLLPVVAERYVSELKAANPDLVIRDEGKARVNSAPGYQIGFRTGPPDGRTFGRDVLLVPDEPGAREGVVLSFRQINRGVRRLGEPARDAVVTVKRAFRSFRFGTERP
jgi:hypothetical protein